jgi:putative SOS response-associated peptidase YedK
MCGRFAVTTDPVLLAEQIQALDETGGALSAPNYNVAPTTDIAAVVARHDEPDDQARRRLRAMRWGLLPPWALDPTKAGARGAHPLINARAETLTTSPAFRAAARHRRCLVPMDGYYEWKPAGESPADNPKRGRKTPFYFYRPDGAPLLVAGVWAAGKLDGPTCTIVTTEAAGEFAAVHHRMPLVLGEKDWDRWLDPDAEAPAELLAGPPDIGPMTMREVATLVNNVANNGPELIEAAGPGNQPVGLF